MHLTGYVYKDSTSTVKLDYNYTKPDNTIINETSH